MKRDCSYFSRNLLPGHKMVVFCSVSETILLNIHALIVDPASKDGAIRWGRGAGLKEEVHRRKYSRSLLSSFRLSFVLARETT